MATESVNILIQADNQASGVLTKVGGDVERLGTRVKTTGNQLKAGTQLAGSFANAFGGSAFGSFAGELAMITERVSAFSEVSKAGAVGAIALKAALVGAVAVGSFKVGEAIGNWVFETERWKKELQEAAKAAEQAQQTIEKNRNKRFSEAREDISIERTPADKEAATQAQIEKLERESKGMQTRLNLAREEVANRKETAANAYLGKGNAEAELKVAQDQLAALEKSKQAIDNERQALADTISERAKSIEARKAENAAMNRSDAFIESLRAETEMLRANKDEQRALEAARNVTPDKRGIAEQLLKERDAMQEQIAEKKRIADLEDRELDRLELRRIELEQGKEAARAYALQMEGLSEEFSKNIAAREAAMEAKKQPGVDRSSLQAVQGRLLTRGSSSDPIVDVLKKILGVNEKTTKATEDVSKALRESARDVPFVVKQVNVP